MKHVLVAIGFLMIAVTVLPLLRKDAWWIRILDFPRLQITVLTALALIAYWWLGVSPDAAGHLFLAALLSCLLYQSYRMYPYTVFSRQQVQPSRSPNKASSFSLLFANVMMDNHNAAQLRAIIRRADPDIILTLETNHWWQEQLKDLEQTHAFTVYQPQDNTYGMLLYSRLKLLNPKVRFLVQSDVPSIHTRVKLPAGPEVALHCLHPKPPVPTEEERATPRDAELLLVGREVKQERAPVVVLGDLNDVAWSRTTSLFQAISGLLDPRIGRGFYNTFHAKYPFLRFPLDHFFHSNHFRLVDFRRLEYFGSDHFPVFVRLSYEADAERQQEKLHASASEQEEAAAKIEKAI